MYQAQDSSVFFNQLYVKVGILLTFEKQLYDRIILLRGNIWVLKTSLTPVMSPKYDT